jgi:hypothetical protein
MVYCHTVPDQFSSTSTKSTSSSFKLVLDWADPSFLAYDYLILDLAGVCILDDAMGSATLDFL